MNIRSGGFTLIEMLVVMLIIGLSLSMVSLSGGTVSGQRQLSRFAEQLARETTLSLQEAEADGRSRGLLLYRDDDGAWQRSWLREVDGRWLDPVEPVSMVTTLPAEMVLRLKVEGKVISLAVQNPSQKQRIPDIVLYPEGEITPFELLLSSSPEANEPASITLCVSALGQVSLVEGADFAPFSCEVSQI